MSEKLSFSVIDRALDDPDWYIRMAGAKACKEQFIPKPALESWSKSIEDERVIAAIYGYGAGAPNNLIMDALCSESHNRRELREAAVWAIAQGAKCPLRMVGQMSTAEIRQTGDAFAMRLPFVKIPFWTHSEDWNKRYVALKAMGSRCVPYSWLFSAFKRNLGYSFDDSIISEMAAGMIKARHLPVGVLEKQLLKILQHIKPGPFRSTAEFCCKGVEIVAGREDAESVFDILYKQGMRSSPNFRSLLNPEVYKEMRLSVGKINALWCSENSYDLIAAIYASVDRKDVPAVDERLTWAMTCPFENVRVAAMAEGMRRGIPQSRKFDVPNPVYKKCLNGVIVTAVIPEDAYVIRNDYERTLRTNKAQIVDIRGDFCGEKVGISKRDQETQYRVGELVAAPHFNFYEHVYGAGLYFTWDKKKLDFI